jgi:hypothetical protein
VAADALIRKLALSEARGCVIDEKIVLRAADVIRRRRVSDCISASLGLEESSIFPQKSHLEQAGKEKAAL